MLNVSLQQFNRGIISPLALARTDVARTAFSAETMTNWIPRVLGSMILRPGFEYIDSTNSDAAAKFIPFIFSFDDTALIEITAAGVRVWENETPVTRVTVGSTITALSWVDADESGGVSTVTAGGIFTLTGDGSNAARQRQTVSVSAADEGKVHAIEINVTRGPVVFRAGSGSAGTDNLISETTLDEGFHSITLTPNADFVVEVESRLKRSVIIGSVAIASSGDMLLTYPTTIPWTDLNKVRWDQSGNLVFIAHEGVQQYIIERRGAGSWSLNKYFADDGPFLIPNGTEATITASGLTGNVRLSASAPIFSSDPKGQLYRITSDGQKVESDLSAENTFTNTIKVEGVDSQRVFTIIREGTWVATITLQRSLTSADGPFESLTPTFTANGTGTFDDDLNNQTAWYRIGIETGDYTSGTAELTLDYPIGSITGVARITNGPDDWIERSLTTSRNIDSVDWSPSLALFLAVSSGGDINRALTSSDGITWTENAASASSQWTDVHWSEDHALFVAVAINAGTSSVMTSANGTSWTTRTTPNNSAWRAVTSAQDQSLFCAISSNSATDQVMTSSNGTSWTARTAAEANSWNDITYSEGAASPIFVAVSSNGTNQVMTSSDGITWTSRSAAAVRTWSGVAYSVELDLFVAVATDGDTTDQIMTSSDGITWTSRTSPSDHSWTKVVWASDLGQFVAIANDATDVDLVMVSSDGITWTSQNTPDGVDGHSNIAYSPALGMLAIATGPGASSILTSGTPRFEVEAEVLTDLGGTNATADWEEGSWSNVNGYPGSVAFAEGRLFWAGKNGLWGSVSDSFFSFDSETVGDSGPLNRTIGSGPVDTINWLLSLQRLVLGAEGSEFTCKSTSLDEPLTPNNFTLRPTSDQGSAAVNPVRIDKTGVFTQRGGTRVMQLVYNGGTFEYDTVDLTILAPEVCQPKVVRMAAQRQPDTRIHCVLSDGTVAVFIYDRAEEVRCWVKVTVDGSVEDVVILPGDDGDEEDKVYYVVNRTIDGNTVRYLEKWAKESECEGGTLNKQADAFIEISQASSTTITGLSHLEGESVVVWANGKNLGSYTVSSNSITVSEAVTSAIVGISYVAQWKSTKLAYGARRGTALVQKKIIQRLGVVLLNTHYQGLEYGPDFSTLDDLPLIKDGATVADDTIHANYDEEAFMLQGKWDSDSRLCLQATAPKPCNVLAAIVGMDINEKI